VWNNTPYVERIDTELGVFELDGSFCKKRLKAELRGMELLCSIINSTPVWSFNFTTGRPFLSSNDDGPTILIDIFQCMRRSLIEHDPHLAIYMSREPVCILKDRNNVDTPATDSIVSLVLLGIAGWPQNSTPATLAEKAIMCYGAEQFGDLSELLPSDYGEIQTALHLYEEGFVHEGISVLAQMARRWYVCRCWGFVKIQETLGPILQRLEENEIDNYLRHPDEESDALFLTV
jgi:hypothetical protein